MTAVESGFATNPWTDQETPILTALVQMSARHRVSLHVPGHKQGRLFPASLALWLGQALKLDLTELPGLDNLHHPVECIRASQELAARHYGANETLYSVNGSSAGVMAAVYSTVPGKRILVAGSFHHSFWKGLVLADANPVFVSTAFDWQTMEDVPPTPEDIHLALCEHGDVGAVFLTSPTYTGRIADVRGIAAEAHEAGIPLIVDEAHGAHLGLVSGLPDHSVKAGADIVIQSTHKMLPALTQTAWVHLQGPYADAHRLRQSLLMLQTSSPSYLLLASLDAAQAWLRLDGAGVVEESLNVMQRYPEVHLAPGRDPFKQWIPTGSLKQSRQLADALADIGVLAEYADTAGVLFVLGLEVRERDVERYLPVLSRHSEWLRTGRMSPTPPYAELTGESGSLSQLRSLYQRTQTLILTPREAEWSRHESVNLTECTGRVAGRVIAPYPPGIPVVFPGQLLDATIVAGLTWLRESGYPVVGLAEDGTIDVLLC